MRWISVKWNNCTQTEAQEAYDYAKSKYRGAAEEYLGNKKKLDSYYDEYRGMTAQADSFRSEKLSFEKRIEDIGEVISLLGEDGPVENAIAEANRAAKYAEGEFARSIVCSGVNSPPLGSIFSCPTVTENSYSLTALNELKKEKARLEQALAEVNAKINAMELEAERLMSQMNSLAVTQNELSRTMKNCSFEMVHYKKYA